MTNSSKKIVQHVRPTHFTSAVATGVAVTGPTDDGFVHLHFYRETQRITHDDVPSRSHAPNEVELAWGHAEPSIHLVREEVAVISVPVSRLPFIGTVLNKAVRFVASLLNASRPSRNAAHPTGAAPASDTLSTRPRVPA
ncbi:hypothetical protein IM816_10645 [Luteibacter flocculans]|uniref:Uncharacterized protein n=1 Tax=Luteibacter flocculans TaxID=2780091 RepID=A0ABY4T2G1_9GAMM|nr:hypothetical protein [Luteibacter flocculans]URL57114.1 hypothetical protein IM816_10645 [Luteibacter flocculans]